MRFMAGGNQSTWCYSYECRSRVPLHALARFGRAEASPVALDHDYTVAVGRFLSVPYLWLECEAASCSGMDRQDTGVLSTKHTAVWPAAATCYAHAPGRPGGLVNNLKPSGRKVLSSNPGMGGIFRSRAVTVDARIARGIVDSRQMGNVHIDAEHAECSRHSQSRVIRGASYHSQTRTTGSSRVWGTCIDGVNLRSIR